MLTNLVSMITKTIQPQTTTAVAPKKSYNPFAQGENPFLGSSFNSSTTYGKNTPVAGGYFAGYYNGKPNIVGRKLFIEV